MKVSKTLCATAVLSATLAMLCAPGAMAKPSRSVAGTTITIRADRPGAQINKNVYGQFSEHLGAGIYGGIWVGEDFADSQYPRHPKRCGRCIERSACAGGALAGRLFR